MKKLYREEKENRVEYEGVRRIRSSPKKGEGSKELAKHRRR